MNNILYIQEIAFYANFFLLIFPLLSVLGTDKQVIGMIIFQANFQANLH